MSMEQKQQLLSQAKAAIENTSAYKNLQLLFDGGVFSEIDAYAKSENGYAEVIAAYGMANGCPIFAFAQNSDIAGGAMSTAQAAKLKKLYSLAVKTGAPVVGLYDSTGARLMQGVDMLSSFGSILNSVSTLSGVVPQISVVLGACLGIGALNASGADFVILSEKARLSLATNGEGGSCEDAENYGLSHLTAKNTEEAIEKARTLLGFMPSNNLSPAPAADTDEPEDPQNTDVIKSVFDNGSFLELQSAFGKNAVVGFARLYGSVAGIVKTNGQTLLQDDCTKIARFVKFCDAFTIPVVTFADSKGFGCLKAASHLTAAYADATTVKVTVITGEAYGAFYVAVAGSGANTDVTLAWANAAISPLPPEAGAAIMWEDKMNAPRDTRQELVKTYKEKECSAFKAAANGYVQDVIAPQDTRNKLFSALDMLSGKRVSRLPKKHGTIL